MKNVLFPRFSDDHLWLKVAVGVLLMFVPIANIFAFGYLYRFLRMPCYATDGGVHLPEWNGWLNLAVDGLRLVVFVAVYVAIASALALAAKWLVIFGSVGVLGVSGIMLRPLFLVLLFPCFFVCLMVYQSRERAGDILKASLLCHYLRFLWWPMIWPALGFVGLQTVCGLLYGIAWFVGFGVAIASFNELLRHYGDRIDEDIYGDGLTMNNSLNHWEKTSLPQTTSFPAPGERFN
jgi:hypothetical protein